MRTTDYAECTVTNNTDSSGKTENFSQLAYAEDVKRKMFKSLLRKSNVNYQSDDEMLYNNLMTYLRIKQDVFDEIKLHSILDSCLTHPINYHKTKMICAAAEYMEEIPVNPDDMNKIISKCKNDIKFINLINLTEEKKKEVISHCVNLVYERNVFEGLADKNVFEMVNHGYKIGDVYDGCVVKVMDDTLIVSVNSEKNDEGDWSVLIKHSNIGDSSFSGASYGENRDQSFGANQDTQKEYFPNDQVKIRLLETNILGLSFRGEIVSSKSFFLKDHPLFHDCNANQAETILKSKRQILLIRKNQSDTPNQLGDTDHIIIVYNLNNDVFIHYKLKRHNHTTQNNQRLLFNNIVYEDVDQIICNYFRELLKFQMQIESDKTVDVRYSKTKPGAICDGILKLRNGSLSNKT